MALKEELDRRYKEAMKARGKIEVSVIRMIKAAISNEEIDKQIKLDDAGVTRILATLQKQRLESIRQFELGGRQDLVDKENAELEIIRSFLPQELTPEELRAEVAKTIEELEASSVRELGKVMKALMPKITGRADGKEVNVIVKEMLDNK